jgi:DNA modification methylase
MRFVADEDAELVTVLDDTNCEGRLLLTADKDFGKIGHPARFPLELPKRCLKLFSYVGDTVLDPFAGSGTTLLAALMHNRQAIGVEIEPAYCELANQRILQYLNARQLALSVEEEPTPCEICSV